MEPPKITTPSSPSVFNKPISQAFDQLKITPVKTFPSGFGTKSVEVSGDGRFAYAMVMEDGGFLKIDTATHEVVESFQFKRTPAYIQNIYFEPHAWMWNFEEWPVECNFTDKDRFVWMSLHNGSAVAVHDTSGKEFSDFPKLKDRKFYEAERKNHLTGKVDKVKLLSVPTGKVPKIVQVAPKHGLILTSNWSGASITAIDSSNFMEIKKIKMKQGWYIPRGIAVDDEAGFAYVANMVGGTVSVIDLKKLELVREINTTSNPGDILIMADRKTLLVADNANQKVSMIDIASGQTVKSLWAKHNVLRIKMTPDEKYLIATLWYSHKLAVIDLKKFQVQQYIDAIDPIGIAISPDGKQLWVTAYHGKVYSYDLKDN